MTHIQAQITDDRRYALDGFSQLTDMLFDVPQMPMPTRISHTILAEDDEAGVGAVARIAQACDEHEVPYRNTSTYNSYAITITYNNIEYEIFYTYRWAMRAFEAEQSYTYNLRAVFIDMEGEC